MTVVVSTRDRAATVCGAVRTILQNDYPTFELVVVDQSADASTRSALESFRDHPRMRYLSVETRGVSAGRNEGVDRSDGEIILITDDDCEVPPNWIRDFVAAFSIDPTVGVVFGNVVAGPHDASAGFVPAYVRSEPFLATEMRDKPHVEGISACLGTRRSVWQSLGGFDCMLGAGAPFRSGAESDYAMRSLQAGHAIYETPKISVIHHGFRDWERGRELIGRYWFGTGAMFAKLAKRRPTWAIPLLLKLGLRWLVGRSRVAASLGPRAHRRLRLGAFARGFLAGLRVPVGADGHFVDRPEGR